MKKILLVDDKVTIGRVLKIYLGTEYDLENVIIQVINHLHVNAIAFYSTCKGNKTGTKSII